MISTAKDKQQFTQLMKKSGIWASMNNDEIFSAFQRSAHFYKTH